MQFSIAPSKLKSFTKVMVAAARYSDTISIHGSEDGLKVEVSARSAYFFANFRPLFFTHFTGAELKCSLRSKAVLLIFKNSSNIDKRLTSFSMHFETDADQVIVKTTYRNSVAKVMNVSFGEFHSFNLEPNLKQPRDRRNSFATCPRTLMDGFHNFGGGVDLVSMSAKPNYIKLENYDPSPVRGLHTKFRFLLEEFERYEITETVNVVFSWKNLKTFLQHFDLKTNMIDVIMENSSRPLFFEANQGSHTSTLVLSTNNVDYLYVGPDSQDSDTNSNVETVNHSSFQDSGSEGTSRTKMSNISSAETQSPTIADFLSHSEKEMYLGMDPISSFPYDDVLCSDSDEEMQ